MAPKNKSGGKDNKASDKKGSSSGSKEEKGGKADGGKLKAATSINVRHILVSNVHIGVFAQAAKVKGVIGVLICDTSVRSTRRKRRR